MLVIPWVTRQNYKIPIILAHVSGYRNGMEK